MSTDVARLHDRDDEPAGLDPVVDELYLRLKSLDENCLRSLQEGLTAMLEGDNTYRAQPVTEPLAATTDDPHVRGLVDLFNSMLSRSQAALVAYEDLRRQHERLLGTHSVLFALADALKSLDDHCLTDLDVGLQAVVEGDLTRDAAPCTRPLRPGPDERLGELGETFNRMLARSRTALHSYNTMREDLRVSLGDQSCLDELRQRLTSLYRHCLRDLDEGLEAVATGTGLTRSVMAVTKPIESEDDRDLGELAEVFNRMLARAQSSLAHYDELRRRDQPF